MDWDVRAREEAPVRMAGGEDARLWGRLQARAEFTTRKVDDEKHE
jgi:hypothetical protein